MNGRRAWGLVWVALLAGCAAPLSPVTPLVETASTPVETVRVVCPESLAGTLTALASTYQRVEPTTQLVVVQRADPLALELLARGDADVALLTWLGEPRPAELWTTPLAHDGLAVIVHPQNGLPGLTLGQLRELFQGRAEDWAVWGGLPGSPQIISREESAGDFAFLQARVMGEAQVTLTALVAPTTEAMLAQVAAEQLAVGYLSVAHLTPQVRALAIEGVPPAPEMIAAGHYPLSRDLYVATLGEPQNATRAFIQWLLGPEGQALIAAQGFQPLSP